MMPSNESVLSAVIKQRSSTLPMAELILGTITYLIIIFMTIIGNVLVIIAVFQYRPLRKVQNYFLVSLAASDISVGLFVMPLHVVKFLAGGRWLLGVTICQLFTTADILLCTSSILNLCAIAIDRYWAIHDPIGYAQKRSMKLVGGMIVLVWVLSAVISVPPLIGWNDWSSHSLTEHCELTTERAFVVFSACGSFFVPLLVMCVVYVKIFLNARRRIRTNRGRSALHRMSEKMQNDKNVKKAHRVPAAAASMIAFASANAFFKREKKAKRISAFSTTSTDQRESSSDHAADTEKATCPPKGIIINRSPVVTVETIVTQIGDSGGGLQQSPHPGHSPRKTSILAVEEIAAVAQRLERAASPLQQKAAKKAPPSRQNGSTAPVPNATSTLKLRLQKISVAKEKRAAKTIAVIIFVFVFCWLPFFCAYVIMPFCEKCYLHSRVSQAFLWLGYINSSLNPFLYGILNVEFRRAFRRILCPKRALMHTQRRSIQKEIRESDAN